MLMWKKIFHGVIVYFATLKSMIKKEGIFSNCLSEVCRKCSYCTPSVKQNKTTSVLPGLFKDAV